VAQRHTHGVAKLTDRERQARAESDWALHAERMAAGTSLRGKILSTLIVER
jgi:hypothetical protein